MTTVTVGRPTSVVADPAKTYFMWFWITNRCNEECEHCYAGSGPLGKESLFSTKQWKAMLSEAKEAGVQSVQFIGGEPTTFRGLSQLVRHATAIGLEVEVFSNLVHVTRSQWRAFRDCNVSLATSFYSALPETHDAITHSSGNQPKILNNIKRALGYGLKLRVGLIRTREDQDIKQAYELLQSIGVRNIGTDDVRGVGRGCSLDKRRREDALCGQCARGKLCVNYIGQVFPCVFSQWLVVGNVRKNSLTDIIAGNKIVLVRNDLSAKFAARQTIGPCNPDCRPTEDCRPNARQRMTTPVDCGPRPCKPMGEPCSPEDTCKPGKESNFVDQRQLPMACAPHNPCTPDYCRPDNDCSPDRRCSPTGDLRPTTPVLVRECVPQTCGPDESCPPDLCQPHTGYVLPQACKPNCTPQCSPPCEPSECEPEVGCAPKTSCGPLKCKPIEPCIPEETCVPLYCKPTGFSTSSMYSRTALLTNSCDPDCVPDICNPDVCEPSECSPDHGCEPDTICDPSACVPDETCDPIESIRFTASRPRDFLLADQLLVRPNLSQVPVREETCKPDTPCNPEKPEPCSPRECSPSYPGITQTVVSYEGFAGACEPDECRPDVTCGPEECFPDLDCGPDACTPQLCQPDVTPNCTPKEPPPEGLAQLTYVAIFSEKPKCEPDECKPDVQCEPDKEPQPDCLPKMVCDPMCWPDITT